MILEKDIENSICTWAKNNNWLVQKVKFVENGWNDRLFISQFGLHVWIELKRPKEYPDPLQIERIETLLKRGVKACWTDNYGDAINFLNTLDAQVIPTEGYKASSESGVSWLVIGSWTRENFHCVSRCYRLKAKKTRQAYAAHISYKADVPSLAE